MKSTQTTTQIATENKTTTVAELQAILSGLDPETPIFLLQNDQFFVIEKMTTESQEAVKSAWFEIGRSWS